MAHFRLLISIWIFVLGNAAVATADDRTVCAQASGDVAITACTRAIASGKFFGGNLAILYTNRGVEWNKKGEAARAIADYDQAIRLNPKYSAPYIGRGNALQDKGEFDRAIADFAQAIRFDPKNALAYYNRGNALRAKGEIDRAIADYDQAIRFDPKYALPYNNRGNALHDKGEFDRAIADYDQVIRLDAKNADAYNNRGIALRYKGELDRAIADYDQAIRINPKSALPYNNRGIALQDKGEFDRAIADYDQVIRLDATNALAYFNRGNALGDKGELDRAIADYDQAIRFDPKFPSAFASRGLAYEKKANWERARADFTAALTLAGKYGSDKWAQETARARLAAIEPGLPKPSSPPPEVQVSRPDPANTSISPDGRRVALLIGNSAYSTFPKIRNAGNDAQDLGKVLKELGFEVILGLDLKRADMEDTFIRFTREARGADTALVFYAGHGLQHRGINYFVPVDARLDDETDLRKLVNMQNVTADLQAASRVRILIVDACRDNEAVQQLASNAPAMRSAGLTRGLTRPPATDGMLIAFATQPDQYAADGDARNSPFTQALLRHLGTTGLELRTLMTRVRAEVVKATRGAQRPEVWDSMVGEFSFRP